MHKKGKIERFNRAVDAFLAEVRLDRPTTLDAFNAAWAVWLAECYQTQPRRAWPPRFSGSPAGRRTSRGGVSFQGNLQTLTVPLLEGPIRFP